MSSLAKNYKRRNISFTKGKGSFLYTKKGTKYLDFVQGIAVNSLGHANLSLVNAITKQSKKLWHVSNSFIGQLDGSITFGISILTFLTLLITYFAYILVHKGYKIKS